MATAYRIQDQAPLSPSLGPTLYTANTAALSQVAIETPAVPQKNKRGALMTTQAPKLITGSAASIAATNNTTEKMSLQDYMNEVLAAMVALQGYMCQLDTAQSKIADGMIQLSIAQSNQANEDYAKYEKAVEAAKHETLWQKICGYVVGAVMSVVGIITCNPELLIAGVLTIAMTATGANDKISQFLQDHISSSGLRCLAEIGIGVAMAVCISGVSAGMEAGVEIALPKAVAQAAENDAVEMVDLGANAAEADGAANIAQNPAADESAGFMSKFKDKITFGRGVSSYFQSTMIVNPFTDGVGAVIDMINAIRKKEGKSTIGDDLKQEISEIAGMVLAVVAAFGSAYASSSRLSEGKNLVDVLAEKRGPLAAERFTNLFLFPLKYLARPGFSIAGGVMGIKAGQSQLVQSDVMSDLANVKATQMVLQGTTTMANAMIAQTQSNFKQVADTFSMINSRWEDFVAPYVTAAEIMG